MEEEGAVKAVGPTRGSSVDAGEWEGSEGSLHNHVQSSLEYCLGLWGNSPLIILVEQWLTLDYVIYQHHLC